MFGLKLALPLRLGRRRTSEDDPPNPAPQGGAGTALSPIASAVVLAAGAGVAFWWWTQWARGRAEIESGLVDTEQAEAPLDASTQSE